MNRDLEYQEILFRNGFNIILFNKREEFQIEVRTNNQLLKSSIFKGNENLLNYIGAENYYSIELLTNSAIFDERWGNNGKRGAILKYLLGSCFNHRSFRSAQQTIDKGFFEYICKIQYKENLVWEKKWKIVEQWARSYLVEILIITNEIKMISRRWGNDLQLSIEVCPEQNKIRYIDLWFYYNNGKFILGPTFIYYKTSDGLSVIPYNLKLEKSDEK
jgi:hypothetical protein